MKRTFTTKFLLFLFVFTIGNNIKALDIKPDKVVTYKTINNYDLKLHIFNPKDMKAGKKYPAIIFFFGGGWVGGTPKQFYLQAEYFASRGMIAISADYRVKRRQGTSPFECVKDGKSAIRWIRQHSKELNINPDKIVASGGSAGGHVAACTAVFKGYNEKGEDLSVSSIPNATILFNPVLDTSERGYGANKLKGNETTISPCHHVRKGIVPTLLLHGTNDKVVPYENALRFTKLMHTNGNICRLVPGKDQGHGFFNSCRFKKKLPSDKFYNLTVYESDIFLIKHGFLKGKPTIKRDI